MSQRHIDIESLSPVQRIELAEALYDSAMQEIDAAPFTPEQLAELDRRIAEIEGGSAVLVPWEDIYNEFTRAR